MWQAGAGEAVIGVLLVAAALRESRALYWTAYVLSVLASGTRTRWTSRAAPTTRADDNPNAMPIGLAILAWRRIQRP